MESGYCQNHVTVIIMVPVLIHCIIELCALLAYIPDTVLKSIGIDLISLSEIEREKELVRELARVHAQPFDQL